METTDTSEAVDTTWIESEVGAALAHSNRLAEALFQEIRAWKTANPAGLQIMRGDGKDSSIVNAVAPVTAPVDLWVQAAGDVLHNLRRTLDAIAWDLGERYTVAPLNSTQRNGVKFPLSTAREDFFAKASDTRSWMSKLPPEYIQRLARTQPFNAKQDPSQSVLLWLTDLDNARKHRGGLVLTEVVDVEDSIDEAMLRQGLGGEATAPFTVKRPSINSALRDGMRVMELSGYQLMDAVLPESLPRTYRISKAGKETTLDALIAVLSTQIVSTIFEVYVGYTLPAWFGVDPTSQVGTRIRPDGSIGEWGQQIPS